MKKIILMAAIVATILAMPVLAAKKKPGTNVNPPPPPTGTAPAAPTGLVVVDSGLDIKSYATNGTTAYYTNSWIKLAWNDVSNESGYKLFAATGSSTNFSQYVNTAANVVTYVQNYVQRNTLYTFYVKAYNAYGSSAPSEKVSVTSK